jgi:RimJ/RimL family protein N-acetyltransferase
MALHRVSLRVVAYNVRAIRCYSACGFVGEGSEREAAYIGGNWRHDASNFGTGKAYWCVHIAGRRH